MTNGDAIDGSVVARKAVQGGAVRLGTFDGITVTSVPEPGSWVMMILGFWCAAARCGCGLPE